MSLFKGKLDSGNKFTVSDEVTGLEILKGYDGEDNALPAYIQLESADGLDNFMWFDDSVRLRVSTSAPDNDTKNSGGTIITAAGDAGANRTLSNLGTVAIDTDFLPNGTIDLGASGNYFAEGYITKLGLYTTNCYITGTSATATLTGAFVVGANTGAAAYDVKFHGYTAGQWMWWDENYNSNAGGLLIGDNVSVAFGAGYDIEFVSGGTDLAINARADNVKIKSGVSQDIDWHWESKSSTSTEDHMGWIADLWMLQLSGKAILAFGGSALDAYDDGFSIAFDDTDTLNIEPYAADDVVRIGETNTADLYLDGAAGYDMVWDASVDELKLYDNAEFRLGTTHHLDMSADGTDFHVDCSTANQIVQWGATRGTDLALHGGTANRDVYWDASENEFFFADSAKLVFGGTYDAATDDLIIQSDGTDVHVTFGATTGCLNVDGKADQTTAAVHINGALNNWNGATGVGMLHISQDTPLAHADASMLLIENAVGGIPINSAKGHMLRLVDADSTGKAGAYLAEIRSAKNSAMKIACAAVPDAKYAFEISAGTLNGTQSAGRCAYFANAIEGTTDGLEVNLGVWTDITGASGAPTNQVRALDVGVYADSSCDTSGASLVGLAIDMQIDDATPSTTIYPMRFNCLRAGSGGANPAAWFHAANPEAVAMSTDSPSAANAYIAIKITGYTTAYIPIYIA